MTLMPTQWNGRPRPRRPLPEFWAGVAWGVLAVVVAFLAALLLGACSIESYPSDSLRGCIEAVRGRGEGAAIACVEAYAPEDPS